MLRHHASLGKAQDSVGGGIVFQAFLWASGGREREKNAIVFDGRRRGMSTQELRIIVHNG